VVGVVQSYYPFLALLLTEGASAADCRRLRLDHEGAFALFRTERGRSELSLELGKRIGEVDWERFERQVEAIREHGVGVITYRDRDFPPCFRDIPDSPPMILYKGDLRLLSRRGIAIVGSRNASARGGRFAASLAAELASCGVTVTSGLARGIDGEAHRGALSVGGATVAVVGTGLDVPYPRQNSDLLESIGLRGCVVSEQLMGTPPQAFVFPLRNRLISALSHMVVVVEAAARSGALLTARWALEQGRDVGAVPGFPGDPRSAGANRLLKSGACLVENANDVFNAVPRLGVTVRRDAAGGTGAATLDAETSRVLEGLGSGSTDPDTLADHLGEPVAFVQRVLLELEMQGLVARDGAGGYHRL
jgi:DNA processing protein